MATLTKELFLDKIRFYLNEEKEIRNDDIRTQPTKVSSIDDFFDSLDAVPSTTQKTSKVDEKKFWIDNKEDITRLIQSNVFNGKEFWEIKEAMEIVRGKYLMNLTYTTIDADYQDMCRVYITLLLQKKAIGIENYLRYFDPNTAYYKRVFALNSFRNLNHPKEEIEDLLPIVGKNLYDSVQLEPDSLFKAENIFKEYIERIFSITRLDKESRIDFLILADDNLDYFYEKTDLNEWLLNIVEQDDAVTLEKEEIEKESKQEILEEVKEEVTEEKKEEVVEEVKEDINKEIIEKIENENREAKEQIKQSEGIIKELKEKFEELQKQHDLMRIENENRINDLNQQLDKLKDENVNLKINNLSKQESLQSEIEEYKAKNNELEKKYNDLQNTSETLLTTNEVVDESPEKVPNEIAELRQFYNIVVVGGSEKTNKKFNRLMNDAEIATEIYKDWGLEVRQFHLEGDYKKQKDKKLAKKVEDALSGNIANFVIILQSDHNTALASLIENPEYTTRITVFGEREENDGNPAYGQKLSNSSFRHYLKRAITKYERDIINSMG